MDFAHSFAGLLVGFLVGLTGVGGGSLMAPLLILLFGFTPATAIGTDLWFAAITKSVGSVIHRHVGSPNWKIVGRLAMGSVPAAIITVIWLSTMSGGELKASMLKTVLGIALIITACLTPLKSHMREPLKRFRRALGPGMRRHQLMATVIGGAAVGTVVTLTSVGAGALVAVMLMMLYPLRLDTKSLVGTDIVHAVPLALVAAIGHFWLGNVDWALLGTLLVGSIPGIIIGSLMAGRINESLVRWALAVMLAVSGTKMLLS